MAIRLGDIQFINSWPVTYGLKAKKIASQLKVVSGVPAQLNRRLLTGELDASAVSSMLYLRHQEEFVPVPGLCIRSEADVASVLVASREPLEKLETKTIGISNQGATTPVLLKLLLKERKLPLTLEVTHLRFPEILEAYPAALLIGDEALQASREKKHWHFWDLGQAWADWTKLPCVFALWVVRRHLVERSPEVLTEIRTDLEASYAWGRAHTEELVQSMQKIFPWEKAFLKQYLNRLSYDFDTKAWEGLRRLSREAEAVGLLEKGTTQALPAKRAGWIREKRQELALR